MPADFSEFKQRFESQASDPEAVIQLLVEGMVTLEQDSELGEQMVSLLCSKKMLQQAPGTPSGFCFPRTNDALNRLRRNPNIARSYIGGTPEGNYQDATLSAPRITVARSYSPAAQGIDYPKPGQAKFFIASGGADSPRPVTLARNNSGQWKVTGFSSLTAGVKAPASVAGDF